MCNIPKLTQIMHSLGMSLYAKNISITLLLYTITIYAAFVINIPSLMHLTLEGVHKNSFNKMWSLILEATQPTPTQSSLNHIPQIESAHVIMSHLSHVKCLQALSPTTISCFMQKHVQPWKKRERQRENERCEGNLKKHIEEDAWTMRWWMGRLSYWRLILNIQ